MTPKLNRGFTLAELLTVVAIIGILSSLLFPTYRRIREQAKSASCLNNLRQMGITLTAYADENNQYPDLHLRMDKLEQLPALDTFLKGSAILRCPSDQTHYASTGTSYFWNILLSGLQPGAESLIGGTDPTKTPLVSDAFVHNNTVFADGHVSSYETP